MALWLLRAGGHSEYEQRFLEENRVYLTWNGLNNDLYKVTSQNELRKVLRKLYPSNKEKRNIIHSSQIWSFSHRMQPGDWLVIPNKYKAVIHIAEITGPYQYDSHAEDPYYHWRDVKWIGTDIPRSNFDQDLLYSFGAAMTICRLERNDAEKRVRAMAENNWKGTTSTAALSTSTGGDETEVDDMYADLEEIAQDQIARLIISKFKGHGVARLVDGILRAQGYTTYLSAEGPDKGIDILAAPGPLGFGEPKICVQVKSADSPIDRPTLDQLIGTMQNVQAKQGLLVSWGGFKTSVDREKANQFFKVRLWDQKDLIEELLTHYNELDDDIRAELPLKRIWTVANPEGEND